MEESSRIVAWSASPLSRRLMAAIMGEYERNGRRTISPGKLRYLRRVIRQNR